MKLKRWNGTTWTEPVLKRWNGSAWVDAALKAWNGSAWVGGAAPPASGYSESFDVDDGGFVSSGDLAVTAARSTVSFQSAPASLKVGVAAGTGTPVASGPLFAVSGNIKIVFWVRSPSYTGNATLMAQWADASGVTQTYEMGPGVAVTSSWQKIEWSTTTNTLPHPQAYLMVVGDANPVAGYDLYIDTIEVTQI